MTKTSRSVYLDFSCETAINQLAKRSFNSNFSAALNWFIKSKFTERDFNLFMAKYHAGQLHHFKTVLDQLEEIKPKAPEQMELITGVD